MLVTYLHVISLHAKFQVIPSIFDHHMAPLSVQCHDVINFNRTFLEIVNIVHQNKVHCWNSMTDITE